jgi:hypothetical protein
MAPWLQSLSIWLRGMLAAFITGASTGILASGSLWAAHGAGVDVPTLNFRAAVIVGLCAGIHGSLAYLAKSPVPQPTQK